MDFIQQIDWNQVSIFWIMFEQVIAASDVKENSSFQVLVSIVNAIVHRFDKKETPAV